MNKINRKYAWVLKIYEGDLRQKWLKLMQELMNHAESLWDYRSVRYRTVMNLREWKDFSEHRERKAFVAKVLDIRGDDWFELAMEVVEDSYKWFQKEAEGDFKDKLRAGLVGLLDCALNAKYEHEALRKSDLLAGRTVKQRDEGIVDPTVFSKVRLEYVISVCAEDLGCEKDVLEMRLREISPDLRLDELRLFYASCRMEKRLRKFFKYMWGMLHRDLTLSLDNLQRGWLIWQRLRGMGVGVEEYLALLEMPPFAMIEKRLLAMLSDKQLQKEILGHMEDELPTSYECIRKQGYVYWADVMEEEAERKEFPMSLRSKEEVQAMVDEAWREVTGYFPLVLRGSAKNLLFNPMHPASTMRAFQSSIRSASGWRVNVIVMTPLSEDMSEYLPTLAHEVTHAIHRMILESAEERGILERGASERLPCKVMEDFSQLVESQFHRDTHVPYNKKYKGERFSNFRSALVILAQIPFSLVQLGVRKKFDEWYEGGLRGVLGEDQLWEIKRDFDRKYLEWEKMGVWIRREAFDSLRFFVAYNPDDGLVYMSQYLNGDLKVKSKKGVVKMKDSLSLKAAMEKRFGRHWIESEEARVLVQWLLLESGRNYKTEEFGRLVLEKEIGECWEELGRLGILS